MHVAWAAYHGNPSKVFCNCEAHREFVVGHVQQMEACGSASSLSFIWQPGLREGGELVAGEVEDNEGRHACEDAGDIAGKFVVGEIQEGGPGDIVRQQDVGESVPLEAGYVQVGQLEGSRELMVVEGDEVEVLKL
jgi:hypothetical protein